MGLTESFGEFTPKIGGMKNKHILLAEDNEGDILLTKEFFAEAGYPFELSIVKDGKEAEDFICRRGDYINALPPDIILMDINLPKKSGFDVLKFIKGHDEFKHIPVIVLTTSATDRDVHRALCHYANAYIMKPPEAEEYLVTMKAFADFWLNAAELPNRKQDCT